jgi:hypothetical protein
MEEIVIILIVGLAAGYLIRRYLKNKKAGGGCGCENASCDIKNTCSAHSGHEAVSGVGTGIETGGEEVCPMNARTLDD